MRSTSLFVLGADRTRTHVVATAYSQTPESETATTGGGAGLGGTIAGSAVGGFVSEATGRGATVGDGAGRAATTGGGGVLAAPVFVGDSAIGVDALGVDALGDVVSESRTESAATAALLSADGASVLLSADTVATADCLVWSTRREIR